jgi:ketosteroid isomerase-like protein
MSSDPSAQIRGRRAESNAAISARDVEAVIALMAEQITVSVAGGPTLVGRDASRVAFAEQFADPAFRGYVREPSTITVHDPPITVSEQGRWVGRWQRGLRREEMRGMYSAEWELRDAGAGWQLVSEVFVSAPG